MGVTHLSGLEVAGVPTMGMAGAPLFTGNWYFVDPVNGLDGNPGTPESPLATLYQAHNLMTAGNNDVAVIVGDGSTAATIRLSLALAQSIDPTVTAGTLVWSKAACHLIGMTAPTRAGQRARIAPPTGTYTQATFGSGTFVSVTAQGCYFANFSLFNGFSTGGANQICWSDTGGRNYYNNVQFGGAGDAASAQATTSRSLLISGDTGENTFVGCTIGLDTVTKTVANASLAFAGGSPRNSFIDCIFPFQTSAATPIAISVPASGIDRWQMFERCLFINNVDSTSTEMTAAVTMAASAGGLLLMKDCTAVGITDWFSDANTSGQMYIDGAAPTAATSGLAVAPA